MTAKIHAVVDALSKSVVFSLTAGQASDIGEAEPLLAKVEPAAVLADKAYDADALTETFDKRGFRSVIPSKSNRVEPRETDFALYCERSLIKRFFNTIRHFRAIATLYDKHANTFLAAIHLVASLICLK